MCNGSGPDVCQTKLETVCTSVDKRAKGNEARERVEDDTKCERVPVNICGRGCAVEEQREKCGEEKVRNSDDLP